MYKTGKFYTKLAVPDGITFPTHTSIEAGSLFYRGDERLLYVYSGEWLAIPVYSGEPNTGDALRWDGEFWVASGVGGGSAVGSFLDLDDTPTSYAGEANKYVQVTPTEDGLQFTTVSGGDNTFIGLLDTPSSYVSYSGYYPRVADTEDGLVWTLIDHADLIGLANDDHTQYSLNLGAIRIVHSGTTRTGNHYSTISDAITAADSGDVILVYPGTYSENLTVNKNIAIVGVERDRVYIYGTVTITSTSKFMNLLIGKDTNSNIVDITTGTVRFFNCRIYAEPASGNATAVYINSGTVEFTDCEIYADGTGSGNAKGVYSMGVCKLYGCIVTTLATTDSWAIQSDYGAGDVDVLYNKISVTGGGIKYAFYALNGAVGSYSFCDFDTTLGTGGFTRADADEIALSLITVELPGNWDIGSHYLRAQTFNADVATGAAPLTIASTTKVDNLNVDYVDGFHASETPGVSTIVATNASGFAKLPGTVQVVGAGSPAAGSGIELFWTGTYAGVLGYNRTTPAYLPVRIIGSQVNIYEDTTNMLEVNGGQVGIAGSPDDILTVNTAVAAKGVHAGSAWMGNWNGGATYAAFAHNSVKGVSGSYGIMQSSGGTTYINAASGADLYFRINNSTVFSWDTSDAALEVLGDVRASSGIASGSVDLNADTGDVLYTGQLVSYKASTNYEVFAYKPLTAALTSTSWDGDLFSDVGTATALNLNTVFGVPANAKAVAARLVISDSGAAAANKWVAFGPTSSYWSQFISYCQVQNVFVSQIGIINCNSVAGPTIYYRIDASGTSTMAVYLEIFGYWI